jgi:hypothetical protein
MIEKFQTGRIEPLRYEAKPYGKVPQVTFSPIKKEGVLVGCVQTVLPKEEL